MKKAIKALAALAVLFILFAGKPNRTAEAGEGAVADLAAWLVDWDVDAGRAEMLQLAPVLSSTQLFAAYFNEEDRPYLRTEFAQWLENNKDAVFSGNKPFLTVVNDIVPTSGENKAKDSSLLTRLLSSPDARERHRRDLLELAASVPCAGLDIDYEQIRQDDWAAFLEFVGSLHGGLAAQGLRLRVVLEPKRWILETPLPKGPEYVVMAYNLFGLHSGPGPKADPAFLARLGGMCQRGGNRMRLALSTGGFVWGEKTKTQSVNEIQARELAHRHAVAPRRDPMSLYLNFIYTEGEETFTVWFADAAAIENLIRSGLAAGFAGVDIWRLGGNSPESLAMLSRLFGVPAESRTFYVGGPAGPSESGLGGERSFATIAEAVRTASDGDRIMVMPGTYRENLVVDKNLRISAPAGYEKNSVVRLVGSDEGPALVDRSGTVWSGIEFTAGGGGEAVFLDGFSGRFEHCRFIAADVASERPLVRMGQSDARFHGCSFTGKGGVAAAMAAANNLAGGGNSWVDFTYCLFRGFGHSMLSLTGDVDLRLANCLMTDNNRLIDRDRFFGGQVSIVNSVLYFNRDPYIANELRTLRPVRLSNSFYTPFFNKRFWVVAPPIETHPGIETENLSVKSPRFAMIGRPFMLNLGIDDTINIDVWKNVAAIAEEYDARVTLAINTGVARDEDWPLIAETFAQGHEIGSHTVSHSSMRTSPPIAVGLSTPEIANARLSIKRGESLRLTSGETVIGEIALDDPTARMGNLARELSKFGVKSAISQFHGNVPPLLLADVDRLDIAFAHPAAPLQLDVEEYYEYELVDSLQAIKDHFPTLVKTPFINPFAINSPFAKAILKNVGYYCARSDVEDENAGDDIKDGKTVFNIFSIPSISFNTVGAAVAGNDVVETMLQLLDYAKLNFIGLSLYSHSLRELDLDNWRKVLELTSMDKNIGIHSLVGMADAVIGSGKDLGDGMYEVLVGEPVFDFHPRSDSPLIEAGVNLGIATDFEGNPIPPNKAPTVGLYQ